MQKFSVPRGTCDILPDEIFSWGTIENKARQVLRSYGYREIRTPVYEETALFKRSLGQTSDIVNKQLLELATNKEEGYALRPEGTASVVRSYLENSFDKKEPLSKLFYIGPMFRGERPQKGRLRQFHQIGVEAIGPNSIWPYLDVEIIALAMHLLKDFGVKNPKLKINSLGSKESKEKASIELRERLRAHKKDLCKDCQDRFERNIFRVLDCKNESCHRIVASVIKDLPLSDGPSRLHFEYVQRLLNDLGVEYEIAPYLVRGLDYYSYTVFEITAEGLGSQDAIGAGGRYADLVEDLGGNPKANIAGIGFALGIERILLATGQIQDTPTAIDAYMVVMESDSDYQREAFKIVDRLRKAHLNVDMTYTGDRSVKSQFSRANKLNARFTLILGEEEFKNRCIAVKDMTNRTQENVKMENVLEYLKKKGVG
jgi:histidyl-tRNA synthetase